MKKLLPILSLAMCLCLCGCSKKQEQPVIATAPPEEPIIITQPVQEKAKLTFRIDGETETVPAYVYEGMDYTVVVPEGGWHMYEPGAWQATFNQKVKFWVKGYSGDNAKKLIEQLSSEGYILGLGGNIMTRTNSAEELTENVMIFRNGDSLRAVFYCYPDDAAGSFGVRLDTIVNTFSWKDPQDNATSGNMAGLTDSELEEALKAGTAVIPTEDGQSPGAAQIQLVIASAEEKAKKLEDQLSKDVSQADMNITSGEIYTLWDDTINTVWQILKENMSESDFNTLLNAQISWIGQKEAAVQAAAAEYEGGSLSALAANQKGAELTRERVYELAKYLK